MRIRHVLSSGVRGAKEETRTFNFARLVSRSLLAPESSDAVLGRREQQQGGVGSGGERDGDGREGQGREVRLVRCVESGGEDVAAGEAYVSFQIC